MMYDNEHSTMCAHKRATFWVKDMHPSQQNYIDLTKLVERKKDCLFTHYASTILKIIVTHSVTDHVQ